MEILRSITLYCEDRGMRFLVSGGHAVNAYGVSRQTGDLDLIVERSRKEDWTSLLKKLRYKAYQDDPRFSRFEPPELAAWPIDLMYVDDTTFEKMHAAANETEIGVAAVRVTSPEHLVTLKIHALKYNQPHRRPKDYGDLIALLRTAASKITEEELCALCERYADGKLYEKLSKDLANEE